MRKLFIFMLGQTKWVYFLTEDHNSFEKYSISDKDSADIKKEFISNPVYNSKALKTKTKSYGDEITDFYYKEIPKVDFNLTYSAVINFNSALKKDENYYPEVFLKECKNCSH